MANYDEPIEGQTMVLQTDADTGYSGESLDWGDGQTGQYRVYWYWDPSSGGYGGITGKNWPDDFQSTIYPILAGLENGTNTLQDVNEALYEYSGGRLFNNWDEYVEEYNGNGISCIRPA